MRNGTLRLLCIFLGAWLAFASWSAWAFTDRYDGQIAEAAHRYLPGVDWRLLKAQYMQESRLDPAAVSPVGAAGVAQMMPGTWAEISQAMQWGAVSPHIARYSIIAGAYYMGRLRATWSAPRPEADRHSLALASYNAGLGNLLKAQRLAGGANLYPPIVQKLPAVTGAHARETITYVRRIWGYWTALMVGAA